MSAYVLVALGALLWILVLGLALVLARAARMGDEASIDHLDFYGGLRPQIQRDDQARRDAA